MTIHVNRISRRMARATGIALTVSAGGAAAMAAGVASAGIPDANGVIHACYQTNPNALFGGAGKLRVIDTTMAACAQHSI